MNNEAQFETTAIIDIDAELRKQEKPEFDSFKLKIFTKC